MRVVFVMVAMTLWLAACGEQKEDIKDTVFAPQVRALEKARSVENTLKQGVDKEHEAIESYGNSAAPERK